MRRRLAARPGRDRGVVMLALIGAMTVLTLLLLVSLAYVLQNAPLGRRDQDAKIAIGAAEAGLEDYLSRLNTDPDYWRNVADPGNPALSDPAGRVIQGTAMAGARYRYRVLSSRDQTARTGVVRVEVSGTSTPGADRAPVVRTLTATLRPRTFLDYVYLTDVEVLDPALTGENADCANYAYGGDARPDDCQTVVWREGDKVDGPLHSNDALTIDGPVNFKSPLTESSWPDIQNAAPRAKTWLGAAATVAGHAPKYAAPLPLPLGNSDLVQYVEPDVDGDGAVGPGCYYTGATRIVLQGTTMRVLSPSTDSTSTPDRCLTVANRAAEQVKPVPPVIYVDGTASLCTAGALGYPVAGEVVSTGAADDPSWGTSTNYDCHRGTAYVRGVADTQVTIAAKDDVLITGDLTVDDKGRGDDVIGVIAGNYVWVHHPLDANKANLPGGSRVKNVDAAILSLQHSFVAQNWDQGAPLGPLKLMGAMAQRFRGPVGAYYPDSGDETGYQKNYAYDERYKTMQPPYFLKPANNVWRVLAVTDR